MRHTIDRVEVRVNPANVKGMLNSGWHWYELRLPACSRTATLRKMISPWQRRIRRAQELKDLYPFAAEILTFYTHLAASQERTYELFSGMRVPPRSDRSASELTSAEISAVGPQFKSFLSMIEDYGTERLIRLSRELQANSTGPQLLNVAWSDPAPSDPSLILAQAFLQPYSELLRSRVDLSPVHAQHAVCPFCHRKPCFGVLRQMGEGGSRSMVCGFCSAEWDFRRIVCPGCGEEKEQQLPIYNADAFDYIRVECCESCKTYIKTIDLTKNGNAEPLVDELASTPLDFWARERGYTKLHSNLLGL